MKTATAIALLILTVATILVMWEPAFWVTAVPEIGVFILAGIWLAAYAARAKELRFAWVLMPLAAVVLWPFLQLGLGTTVYRWATSAAILYWAAGAAIVFVSLQIFDDAGIRRWYLRALLIFGFVISVISPLQLFTAHGKIFWLFEAAGDAIGPFVYTNQYAAFIELVLPIGLAGLVTERGGWRILHALAAAVMYASIFASNSRSGFVLTTAEVLIVSWLVAKKTGVVGQRIVMPALVFLGMLVLLALAVGPESVMVKLQQKDPYHGRREYTESSLRMIADKPLLGVGIGNWSTAYPAYVIIDEGYLVNQAHDDWAQWAAEGGIPFFLFMLSIAVWAFPQAFRTGWGMGVTAVFLHCLVDYPIQRMGVAVVFFTLLGAMGYPDSRRRNHTVA